MGPRPNFSTESEARTRDVHMYTSMGSDPGGYVAIVMEYCVEAMVRGYHVYKDIWTAVELICWREPFNTADPFAVAVVKNGTAVGHVPRKISCVCLLFEWHHCV